MIIKSIEVYKCEYCNKLYQRKHHCTNHELGCKKRPDYFKPCHNCDVLKKVNTTIYIKGDSRYGYDIERIVDVLFCEKLDSFIYPPSVAAKGNAYKLDKLNIEMPKECEFYTEINHESF